MPRSPSERNGRSRSASRSASRSPVERRRKRSRERTFSRDRSGSPNTSKRLHIANLDDSIRRRDIEDAFSKFGKLEDIWVASYPPLYAFVVFQNLEDATSALKEMRSGYIRDCHIRTTVALPRNSGARRGPPRRSGFRSRSPEYRRRRSPPAYRRRSRSRSPDRRRRRSRS
jgi:RNA recognition motif-containing protein